MNGCKSKQSLKLILHDIVFRSKLILIVVFVLMFRRKKRWEAISGISNGLIETSHIDRTVYYISLASRNKWK